MLHHRHLDRGQDRNFVDDDTIFLYRCAGRIYEYLQDGKNSQIGTDVDIQGSTSQQKLCANVAAQIVAFACGKADENRNKNFEGGRPSSIIIGDQVNPKSMGALLAHFENKVMFQGFLWNINSFDQEGVQLGKVLAKRVLAHETDGALKVFSDLLNI